MKKTIIAILVLVLSLPAFSQENVIDQYYQDYTSNKAFTKISVSGAMFQLVNHIEVETEEEEELKDAIGRIKGMIVLACDSCQGNEKELYTDANKRMPAEFEELMLVEDNEAEVRFSIRESDGVISEMLVAVHNQNTFVLVDIWGDIDLKNIRKLTEAFDVEAMKAFDPKTAVASRSVNYYPNPVRRGANGSLNLPNDLLGATVKLYSLDGKLLHEFVANKTVNEIPLSRFNENTIILNVYKDNSRLYTERIVVVN